MAEMILLKCPQCGANLSIEKGRTEAYCTYCGAKLFIDTNHEYTIHNVNEADITRAETDRMIRMEQLRMQKEEKEIKRQEKLQKSILEKQVFLQKNRFNLIFFSNVSRETFEK